MFTTRTRTPQSIRAVDYQEYCITVIKSCCSLFKKVVSGVQYSDALDRKYTNTKHSAICNFVFSHSVANNNFFVLHSRSPNAPQKRKREKKKENIGYWSLSL